MWCVLLGKVERGGVGWLVGEQERENERWVKVMYLCVDIAIFPRQIDRSFATERVASYCVSNYSLHVTYIVLDQVSTSLR